MVTRRDYTAEAVKAAKRVLVELAHRLGEHRNDVVAWADGYRIFSWRIQRLRTSGAWISIWLWITGNCGRKGIGYSGTFSWGAVTGRAAAVYFSP